MTEKPVSTPAEFQETPPEEATVQSRREFLLGLGQWSQALITGAVLGAGLLASGPEAQAAAWLNRRM